MDVPISHVIGSIALMLLTISVASYFIITYSHVQSGILKQQLREVGEYIQTNLIEIIALVDFKNFLDKYATFKILELPPDLSGYAYAVELTKDSENVPIINLYLISRRDVSVSLKIPLNTIESNVIIYTANDPWEPLPSRGGVIKSSGKIYSGIRSSGEKVVVWGWVEGKLEDSGVNLIWAGIGVWEEG